MVMHRIIKELHHKIGQSMIPPGFQFCWYKTSTFTHKWGTPFLAKTAVIVDQDVDMIEYIIGVSLIKVGLQIEKQDLHVYA